MSGRGLLLVCKASSSSLRRMAPALNEKGTSRSPLASTSALMLVWQPRNPGLASQRWESPWAAEVATARDPTANPFLDRRAVQSQRFKMSSDSVAPIWLAQPMRHIRNPCSSISFSVEHLALPSTTRGSVPGSFLTSAIDDARSVGEFFNSLGGTFWCGFVNTTAYRITGISFVQ
ncbi:hypothetical protein PG984_013231 [Apiospora sp. TS-2023a]